MKSYDLHPMYQMKRNKKSIVTIHPFTVIGVTSLPEAIEGSIRS